MAHSTTASIQDQWEIDWKEELEQEWERLIEDGRKPRVLLVDDNAEDLEFIAIILRHEALEVYPVKSAHTAFKVLDQTEVDIIISDIELPDLDGLRFIRTLRTDPRFSLLPMILLTGSYFEDTECIFTKKGPDLLCFKKDAEEMLSTQIKVLLS